MSPSTIAKIELQDLCNQMQIDCTGSPDNGESQEESVQESVHELISKIKQYSDDSLQIPANHQVREGLNSVLSRINQLQSMGN